ncbi:MAG: galactokinase family protein [Limisphaerales bacterium]
MASHPTSRRAPTRDPVGATRTLFKQAFGHAPTHLVQAPARLELLGSHAEWNDGLALAVAVDRHLCLASAPRTDGRIEAVTSAYPQREVFWLSEFAPNPDAPWTVLLKAMLRRLRDRGVHFGGFNAAVHSEIPPGAGYGSSGALLAATALTIRELYPHKLTETGAVISRRTGRRVPAPTKLERLRTAQLCRQAGEGLVGEAGGRLDALASLCGEEFSAVLVDAQQGTVEVLPLIGEMALVVCDTGRFNPIVEAQSAALRFHCAGAARVLGVKSLRAVEPARLKAARDRLTARQHACAYHVVGENQRVVAAERALREGDLGQFGQYLFQSHESAREFFQNSSPEMELLVELARAHPACLGARLSGHGFGGYTVNLVLWNDADEFCARMEEGYAKSAGRKLKTLRCRVVDGAEAR